MDTQKVSGGVGGKMLNSGGNKMHLVLPIALPPALDPKW